MQQSIETLRGFGAFTRVITYGKKYEEKPVKAFVYLSPSKKMLIRVGFAVSKGLRKATLRNRIKRLMRESFRINKQDLIKRLCSATTIEIVFLYNGSKEIVQNRSQFASINRSITNLCSTVKVVFSE